jgi:hypothetical protein
MSKITIQKAKLVKGESLEVTYSKTEAQTSENIEVNEKHTAVAHQDLKDSFQAMAVHLALLSDFLSPDQIKDINKYDPKLVEKFTVRGFSVGGNEGEEGVVIMGHKILRNGKALGLNTPFSRFDENPETRYTFMDDLQTCIKDAETEVLLYINGDKVAPDPQADLPFPEDDKSKKKNKKMQVA